MTIKELAGMIGKVANVKVESWVVPMLIKDVKQSYGNVRFLVSPMNGTGEAWVSEDRVRGYSAPADIKVELVNYLEGDRV